MGVSAFLQSGENSTHIVSGFANHLGGGRPKKFHRLLHIGVIVVCLVNPWASVKLRAAGISSLITWGRPWLLADPGLHLVLINGTDFTPVEQCQTTTTTLSTRLTDDGPMVALNTCAYYHHNTLQGLWWNAALGVLWVWGEIALLLLWRFILMGFSGCKAKKNSLSEVVRNSCW